jgi:hypothetical protein
VGNNSNVIFWHKIPEKKRKCETVRSCDGTASFFDAKVRREVFTHFHTALVKRHSSMQKWLFSLPARISSEKPL